MSLARMARLIILLHNVSVTRLRWFPQIPPSKRRKSMTGPSNNTLMPIQRTIACQHRHNSLGSAGLDAVDHGLHHDASNRTSGHNCLLGRLRPVHREHIHIQSPERRIVVHTVDASVQDYNEAQGMDAVVQQ